MRNLLESFAELSVDYRDAAHRQFWLDYDGSLVPFAERPDSAVPSDGLRDILRDMASDDSNQVIIISGRDSESLGLWLGDLPLDLVAEHGAFVRRKGRDWEPFLKTIPKWKSAVRTSLRALTQHYEGSFMEEKNFSLVWHYREIVDRLWPEDVLQVIEALRALNIEDEASIYSEACSIEIRSNGIDKGRFLLSSPWRNKSIDFGLVLGDGRTDEDLFRQAPRDFYTVKVSPDSDSLARYFLSGQEDVLPFLRSLIS